jgi:hypothetical protein
MFYLNRVLNSKNKTGILVIQAKCSQLYCFLRGRSCTSVYENILTFSLSTNYYRNVHKGDPFCNCL